MLVLTRRIGEGIVIDDNIQITVLAVTGSKVRLGITAPAAVGIQRDELMHPGERRPFGTAIAAKVAGFAGAAAR
ncbi:MAG TPA: carbon storage regulator [Gemmataceae bacterium]|nr:carbon storage regulator [Gemmataceae bacterium]